MQRPFDRFEKYVWVGAILVSLVAWYISFTHGYVLTYNDAASHLNIARRVFDNLTPGFAQIGTVWLPLPHILMLIFAWNDFLWHTGLAGSIISMTSFVVAVGFVYKTVFKLTKNPFAATLGATVMILNPNFLYLQTTPMTEPLLIALISIIAYLVACYIEDPKVETIVLLGAFVSAATLTRYDGWFIYLTLLITLPVWNLVNYGRAKAEGALFLFAPIGGFGIFLWFLWNLVIFGDPLYFMTGPYSAYTQQRYLHSVGQLPTEGHIWTSIFYYVSSVIDNNGLSVCCLSIVALAICAFAFKKRKIVPIILIALAPLVFNIISLFLGQSGMDVPQAAINPGLFNIRYGLIMLPAIAILVGLLATLPKVKYFILAILLVQLGLFVMQGKPIILVDGMNGLKSTTYTVVASKWIKENYQGGLILTSLASHDAFVARAQLPIRDYVHEGTREYWDHALFHPSGNVEYIATMVYPPDLVYKAIKDNPDFIKNFDLVYSYDTFFICACIY